MQHDNMCGWMASGMTSTCLLNKDCFLLVCCDDGHPRLLLLLKPSLCVCVVGMVGGQSEKNQTQFCQNPTLAVFRNTTGVYLQGYTVVQTPAARIILKTLIYTQTVNRSASCCSTWPASTHSGLVFNPCVFYTKIISSATQTDSKTKFKDNLSKWLLSL